MAWARKIYAAFTTKGVYKTSNFSDPGTQPTWAADNTGLAATDVRQFGLDPYLGEGRQYCLLEASRDLYRRETGGDWEVLLSAANAATLFGGAGWLCLFYCDTSIQNRMWVAWLTYQAGGNGQNVKAAYSDDAGDNWSTVTQVTNNNLNWNQAINGLCAKGDVVWISSTRQSDMPTLYSSNKGASWTELPSGNLVLAFNPAAPSKVYSSRASDGAFQQMNSGGSITVLAGRGTRFDGQYLALWFDPDDADHQMGWLWGSTTYSLSETTNDWATYTNTEKTHKPLLFAPWSGDEDGKHIIGLTIDMGGGGNRHHVAVLNGLDATPSGISGAHVSESPYVGTIPEDAGVFAIGGLAAVQEDATAQPVPNPDDTITPPGEDPITLGGDAYTQAVTMPDYEGLARGEPMAGDRGAFDVETDAHAKLHASDLLREAPTRHTPLPGTAGQVVTSDGTKWTSAPLPTPEPPDAADVPYTPDDEDDWNAPPDDAAEALDELADRVTAVEDAGLADHDHSGDAGDGGAFDAANLTSGAADDGQVLTADGAGGAAWEDAPSGGLDATGVTEGYVPTAQGDDTWEWAAPEGGEGSGGTDILQVQVFS